VPTDFGEREPADLDEAEEPLGRERAVVLVRVAHVPVDVPVDCDGQRHGVGRSETLHELRTDSHVRSGVASTMGRYVAISVGTGEMARWHRGQDQLGFVEV